MIDQIDIFKSGFVLAFIDQYCEHQNHSYYPDKDRLLYILCDGEREKQVVTKEQIEIEKNKIKNLGFEELSFAYLLSCRPEYTNNFSKPQNTYDFWLDRFTEEFENHNETFIPIIDHITHLESIGNSMDNLIENQSSFWRNYSENLKPKVQDILTIITDETSIHVSIDLAIEEYNTNGYWDIDFEEFKTYIDVSKPIEMLFNLAELLVSLSRLEMFQSFLTVEESLNEKEDRTTDLNIKGSLSDIERDWFKVGLKFADGTINYKTFGRDSFAKITTDSGLSSTLRPYVSDTYNNSGQKNIFSNKNKMCKIYDYCIDNGIAISQWFLEEYQKFHQ